MTDRIEMRKLIESRLYEKFKSENGDKYPNAEELDKEAKAFVAKRVRELKLDGGQPEPALTSQQKRDGELTYDQLRQSLTANRT